MLKGMSVAATTLGCKVNQAETDSMLDMLKAAGANIVEFDEKADIYIVNTCSVTNIADKKSRQMLHRARKMNPDGIVIAAGCYVQSAREILEQDEAIDIVISNNKKKSITEIVNDYINVRNNGKNAPGKDHEAMEYFVDISRETEYEEMGGHGTHKGICQDPGRLQSVLLILHNPVCKRKDKKQKPGGDPCRSIRACGGRNKRSCAYRYTHIVIWQR